MDNYSAAVNLSGGGGERRMPGGMGLLLAEQDQNTTSLGKQPCRDAEEIDDRRGGGPMKVARTDAALGCSELKMYMATATDHHNLVRNSGGSSGSGSGCVMSEGRLAMSPTNSNASDGIVLTHDGSGSIVSEGSRLLSSGAVAAARPGLPFQVYHYKPAGGMPMSMSLTSMGMVPAVRPPFTPSQWQELEHQALIFKFMMAGVQVPSDLLLPIRKSLLSYPSGSHPQPGSTPWASFQMGGYGSNVDLEPGRCRRTDGKKWRCSRDVVPDQKYCERHMHRGRHRGSRKPVEGHTATANTETHNTTSNTSSNTTSTSTSGAGAGSSSALNLAGIHSSSNLRPPLSMSSQPQTNQNPNVPRNLSFGGNNGSQFHQYPLQVSSTPTKDYRYLNGMKGGEMDEQILFSEASGSAGANNQWRSKISANNSFLNYNCTDTPQLRTRVKQEFGLMTEGSHATSFHTNPHQEQHHSFLASSGTGREHQGRGGQGQPLRHFFDEWPRSRDPWTTHVEDGDERSSRGGNPSTTPSPRGKLSLSPLKLSMSREDDSDDPLNVDPVKMGLAVGMNMKLNVEHRQQQVHHTHTHTNWMPNAWENPMGMLGPLAEVLQSSTSTPRGNNNNNKPPGLNLMNDIGWNSKDMDTNRSTSSPLRDSHNSSPSCIASSPKGVLQKTFGSISETTNSAGTSSSQIASS